MSAEKEIKDTREPGLCVIRDDNQDWGGPETEEKEILKEKRKKVIANDEPMNWPYNRHRS